MPKKQHDNRHRGKRKSQSGHAQKLQGILQTSSRGTGTVMIESAKDPIFIEDGNLRTALHGDMVSVRPFGAKRKGLKTGEVIEVLTRAKTTFVGTLEKRGEHIFAAPQETRLHIDFIIPEKFLNNAKVGEKVLLEMQTWDDPRTPPEGHILKVIGKAGEHETEMTAILLDRGIHSGFPTDVARQATALQKKASSFLKDALATRSDMRDVPTFTIDPEDAKDFDDALSVRTLEDGSIEIGVHIADVTHYVEEATPLDKEAHRRGTSIYMVDRTIPMLPEVLSNDLCSLNPNEDKLTFSVVFTIDGSSLKGRNTVRILDEQIRETVTHSDHRFTYKGAQDVLDGTSKGPFQEELEILHNLAVKMRAANKKQGAISFDQEEVRFELDAHGTPQSVYTKPHYETMSLIEQFMLAANRAVSEYVKEHVGDDERLFLYRVHDYPNPDRVIELVELLRSLGYTPRVERGTLSAQELNRILAEAHGTPEENMVQTATVRSMAKAIYSLQNIGHYGLGFRDYTHFTSPIRRYPDMIVHRLLKHYLLGHRIPRHQWKSFQSLSDEASLAERTALEAERASIRYKQAEYMQARVGQEFDGVITGVTDWGIFVQDKVSHAEGLVRVRELSDDYYLFEKSKMRLRGTRKGKIYRLGDDVRFRINSVNVDARQIDCSLVVGR